MNLLLILALTAAPKKVVRSGEAVLSTAEETARKTMAAELKRGRQLADKGKHAEAVAAFDAALRAVPDEPRVLSELGVELRAAGELARAEEACRKAALSKEPQQKAKALYNLGRVLEQKGDKPGAIAAYAESVQLRENRTVRERLLDLDPKAASDRMQPAALDGPHHSVDAWCGKQEDKCHFGEDSAVDVTAGKLPKPWLGARIFTIGEGPEDCVLALRLAKGWYLGRSSYCKDDLFRHDVAAELESSDVLGTPGYEIIFSLHGTDSMKDFDEELGRDVCCLDADFAEIAVCGVGASGVPSCTPTIALKPGLEGGKGTVESGLQPRWSGDELVLERADKKPIDDKKARLAPLLRASAGRHRIVFP